MALAVTLLVKVETKWLGTKKTFEWFYTAGRNVKTGLIASSVVSAWTWAGYTPSIFNCGISVWNKWTLLVCCWGKHPDSSFRNFGHRA